MFMIKCFIVISTVSSSASGLPRRDVVAAFSTVEVAVNTNMYYKACTLIYCIYNATS